MGRRPVRHCSARPGPRRGLTRDFEGGEPWVHRQNLGGVRAWFEVVIISAGRSGRWRWRWRWPSWPAARATRRRALGRRCRFGPAELRLDGVDPCTLLTAAQVRQLGVVAGGRLENTDELGSVGCRWPNSRQSPSSGYVARLLMNRAADSALPGAIGAQVVTIDGFSAVRAAAPGVDPKNHCILVVDVAPGQSLWVQWLTISPNYPGLSHELACQQARDAARLMLSNLRGLSR